MTEQDGSGRPSAEVLAEIAALLGRPAPAPGDDLVLTADEFDRLRRAGNVLSDDARLHLDDASVRLTPHAAGGTAPSDTPGTRSPTPHDERRKRAEAAADASAAKALVRVWERLGKPIPDELRRLASSAR